MSVKELFYVKDAASPVRRFFEPAPCAEAASRGRFRGISIQLCGAESVE